ncbi:BTAD domain-containing putative transcriptional regulator [Hamadaea tsunoensis]|uniref:BTAD domain-containing putative transcriptional regulator n=1 Tax=Hamadaea tsunoensis TaxID=53368 RepID=UPI00041CEFF7|nr:BTAD domain-containing putative transcriptional regulator [Hamadaea tsunoensis]
MLIRLLGPVDVLIDGTPRPVNGVRRRALLAALALRCGEVVSTDTLMDVVWGPDRSAAQVNTLQRHISYLRDVLGGRTLIVARPPGYVLRLDPRSVDAGLAEDLVRRGTRPVDPAHRAEHLRAALALWRGRPLADVDGVPSLMEQARHLEQLRLRATRALIEARLAMGEELSLVPELDRLTGEHPLDEQLYAYLMLALYRGGRSADALAAYKRLQVVLGAELGVEPAPAVRELAAAMLRQDPVLETAAGRAPSPAPGVWLGGSDVVGRDAELAALRSAVTEPGSAVFVVGEPGIGKSRLVAEAARYAEGRGLTVLRGRAAAAGAQFRPLNEALLSVLRRSGPPDDPQLHAYLPALARLVPEWRVHAAADVDESLVVLAEAVLRLLLVLGRAGGCVLLLEDLHDADADTLAVVDYLVDNASGHPIRIVATARTGPGAGIAMIRAAHRRRTATVLELSSLDDDAVRRLAGASLGVPAGQVPPAVLDRVLAAADGVPLHVEELLAGLVDDGVLGHDGTQWTMLGSALPPLPGSLATTLAARAERLDPETVAVLRAGAILGRRFPAAVAGATAGVTQDVLLRALRTAVDAQLVVPQENPLWYAFRHALTAEALYARLLPIERALLARRAALALAEAGGGFDGWERVAGELWATAGEPRLAAERFGVAGRRAAACGALSTAADLLERALAMLSPARDADLAADLGVALVETYATAGRVADAYALGERLTLRGAAARVALHLRLARVAEAAGQWDRGLDEVAYARRLLGAVPDPALDAVEAELVLGRPAADRLAAAAVLASRALAGAMAAGLPEVVCHALMTLGRITRLRDLAEADALYERGLAVAEAHGLVTWRLSLLYSLGADHAVRHADLTQLRLAREAAEDAGAVVVALENGLQTAVMQVCRGEYAQATRTARAVEETAGRLRLIRTRRTALGIRVMAAGHQGDRADADRLLRAYADLGGEEEEFSSAVHGFGVAFGHLLHEDRAAAVAELVAAAARETRQPTSFLSFIQGPHLLLSVLDGRSGAAEVRALAASVQSQAGWNNQFILLAAAVAERDAGAMAGFEAVAAAYPLARHLGLRLVAPHALRDGWGDPVAWLRSAEAYFHDTAPAVARACRELLREAGTPVPQHRQGAADLPALAHAYGISVREFEVLALVADRLTNAEIGRRLVLSPRTVEKHVASLLAKAGVAERQGLIPFAARFSAAGESG